MHIGVVGPIATSDLLSESVQRQHKEFPKGRPGAPLVSSLINEYIARGHQVLAITIDPEMDDNDAPYVYKDGLLTYIITPCRQRIFRPNGRRVGRMADFYRFERGHMLALLRQHKPDVVHAHWTYEYAMAALAYSPNALITVHDNARTILTYIRTLERFAMLVMARYVFKRGRWFTAVSPYMAQSVGKWVVTSVFVVGNPVAIPQATSRVSLPSQPIVSLVVNGWERRKNSGNALLAFSALQKRHPNAVLWAIGNAFEPDGEAVLFCRQQQIDTSNIIFYGSMRYADVLAKIARSTILLHTSLEESFGMVLAEAMSYGVPVVAGKFSGAVPWVVQDGGLLVDVTDVEAIASAADRLLSDERLYAQLSANGFRAVQTRFSTKAIADQYLDLYRQCKLYPAVQPTDPAQSASVSTQLDRSDS